MDLPIDSMVIFQFAMLNFQRVYIKTSISLWFPYSFPIETSIFLWFSYGFPIETSIFLWFSYGFPIETSIFLWFSYGFPIETIKYPRISQPRGVSPHLIQIFSPHRGGAEGLFPRLRDRHRRCRRCKGGWEPKH